MVVSPRARGAGLEAESLCDAVLAVDGFAAEIVELDDALNDLTPAMRSYA